MNDSYTIHTTQMSSVWSDTIGKRFGPVTIHVDGDCFYGWGEKPTRADCQLHVQIVVPTLEKAAEIAKYVYGRDFEVLVTDTDDWNQIVTAHQVPSNWSARHAH